MLIFFWPVNQGPSTNGDQWPQSQNFNEISHIGIGQQVDQINWADILIRREESGKVDRPGQSLSFGTLCYMATGGLKRVGCMLMLIHHLAPSTRPRSLYKLIKDEPFLRVTTSKSFQQQTKPSHCSRTCFGVPAAATLTSLSAKTSLVGLDQVQPGK